MKRAAVCMALRIGLLGAIIVSMRAPAWAEPDEPQPASAVGPSAEASLPTAELRDAEQLAAQVTIFRDAFGVPHVDGADDRATLFGFAYVQAEDNFWQVEDNYILCLGRYSEVHGPRGLNSDLLNRAFEIVPNSRAAFAEFPPQWQGLCTAFSAGLNYYLHTHPQTKPRLIRHFEPWQVLAYGRHVMLELCFRRTGLSNTYLPRAHRPIWTGDGSNGWAVGPQKTATGHAMLMSNPHLPWFGFSELFEAHLRSGAGWNFTGATTYGSPVLSLGHNEHLGWTLTTNEPDIADVWRLEFDDPARPLHYRSGESYREAQEWRESIGVLNGDRVQPRSFTLRKSHLGPIVAREGAQTFLAARIAGLDKAAMLRQSLGMIRARTLAEFRAALDMQQLLLMNIVYADQQGNIFYLYNGLVPRRDEAFDWTQPVDGSNPRTEWGRTLKIEELPQVLNPTCGYVQNCNSSPFTTCEQSPDRADFPRYLADDAGDDKRRAKRSRQILASLERATLSDLERAAFDTTVYWATEHLPLMEAAFTAIKQDNPQLAGEIEPYLSHLLEWDRKIRPDSTAATLCEAWYTELFGREYPGETMRPRYAKQVERQFRALAKAAGILQAAHGTWKVRWGDLFRIQRHARVSDLLEIPFSDALPSLPCVAGPGQLGVVFTQYYSPTLRIPFFKELNRRYSVIGPAYMAVWEFGPRVTGRSAVLFGASGDPASPHFADQADLISQCKLKPELFDWKDVAAGAVEKYRPGDKR